jgi:cobalt-precorrin-5B (C1)-methyltransferase
MARLKLDPLAFIDMGDFVGGLLKYVKAHPVERLTIAGGFGKIAKLAQGAMDLHSARSQVEIDRLVEVLTFLRASPYLIGDLRFAQSANEVLQRAEAAGLALADVVAQNARDVARAVVGPAVAVDVLIVDRKGAIVGESG